MKYQACEHCDRAGTRDWKNDCPKCFGHGALLACMFPDDEITEVIADPEAHMRELDAAYDARSRE